MDRNQAIGLVLLSILLIVYFQFFAPEPEPIVEESTSQTEQVEQKAEQPKEAVIQSTPDTTTVSDSVSSLVNSQQYGAFALGLNGSAKEFTLENKKVLIVLTNQGANIKEVRLKDFLTYSKSPLILADEASSTKSLKFRHTDVQSNFNNTLDLNDRKFFYKGETAEFNDTTRVTFTYALTGGRFVKQIYTLPKEGYKLGYEVEFSDANIVASDALEYSWTNNLKLLENDIAVSRSKATINYYTADGDFDGLSETSTDYEEETLSSPTKWVAMKQKFFTAAFIADSTFSRGKVSTNADEGNPQVVKTAAVDLAIPVSSINNGKASFQYYFGPNDYSLLKKVTEGFSENLSLGWPPVSWVNKGIIIPLFKFLERGIANYGIIIILIVFIIKLCLSPLSYKSYLSMAKMKVLKPELDEIKKRNEDDMSKVQQEQMKLYRQVGVNPISGCIPMLLQMPILFAMFYFFPKSIELRQQAFLWADDLSTYDAILTWEAQIPLLSSIYGNHVSLFTLLMTLSTILYTWSNNQVSSVQGPMKSIGYVMPIVFMFVLNSFPAALSFYYFVSNLVTFGQQALIRRFVDDSKIKAILDENKKKNVNKKKSKFQMRLEEAMKAGQESKKKGKK
ncbi:MAG: membrane protein insertase YidC [Bacteroidota bacterium]